MRNIRKSPIMLLFNSLSAAKVGLYNDYKLGKKVMTFKEAGVQIVGDDASGTASSPVIPASSGTLSSDLEVAKSCTDDGKRQALEISFTPPAPCEACDWEYWMSIREKVKEPGVRNSKDNLQQKTYTGVAEAIEASGLYVNDTHVLAMEDDFLDQITNDEGAHNINQDPITKMSGAVVNAHRIYYVTLNGANTDKLLVTEEDGTETTIDLDGGTTVITAVNDFNDDTNTDLAAIATGSAEMMVIGPAGDKYTLEDGGGATPVTVERKLLLLSKSEHVQFDVILPKDYGTIRGVYLNALDASTATTTEVVMYIDGVAAAAATDADAVADLVTELNSDGSGYMYAGIAATGGEIVYVYSNSDLVDSFEVTFSGDSTLEWISGASVIWGDAFPRYSPFGRFPSLTSEDIFRMFFNQKDGGKLSAMQYLNQPEEDTDYCVYHIKRKNDSISALHGPSYNTMFESDFVIVVKKSIVDTDYWDKTNPADTGARYSYMQEEADAPAAWDVDTNFEELLEILTGEAPSSW